MLVGEIQILILAQQQVLLTLMLRQVHTLYEYQELFLVSISIILVTNLKLPLSNNGVLVLGLLCTVLSMDVPI